MATAPLPLARRTVGHVVTGISAAVLFLMVALIVRLHVGESRLATLEHPEQALALVVGRTMDARVALADAAAWERQLYALTLTDAGAEIGQSIQWYDELTADSLEPGVDLRLAVLLGEAGRRERLERVLGQWPARGQPLEGHGAALAAVYLGTADVDPEGAAETIAALDDGWFADALALRVAARLGDAELAAAAQRALDARARPLLGRLRVLAALELGLVVVGLVALRGWRRRPVEAWAVADARLPPPWSLGVGLVTLVRGGALAALVLVVLIVGNQWLAEAPILAEALDQPLMYVPLLLLGWRALLAPAGLGFAAAFGLWPRPGGARVALRAAAALVAAGVVIDLVLGVLAEPLGASSHWAEWFDPDLAWGGPAALGVTLLGSVVFAPVFEELIFRGLLYGTLRARFAWPVAALVSALLFALPHGYGAVGFLSVCLSGLLWAWSYERTGSLLPAMTAHVVNNAAVALTLIAVLR